MSLYLNFRIFFYNSEWNEIFLNISSLKKNIFCFLLIISKIDVL